jgi:hypothetical protein
MAKDFIINTNGINSLGARVLTSGIDTVQFQKNPVLLYMHRRGWDNTPIGRVENVRVEGDELRGTPVFDTKDPFAAEIGRKWEEGFLRMCSACVEPVELSTAPGHLLPGQTRSTVTRSKLVEVSIVDIGANDDALQLCEPGGKLLQLAAGVENDFLPLLHADTPPAGADTNDNNNQKPNLQMKNILLALGLPETATEADAVTTITALQGKAGRVEALELSRIEQAVDAAIAQHRATADKRETLITLGKTSGFDSLKPVLDMLTPARKPSDVISPASGGAAPPVTLSYGQMTEEQLQKLQKDNPDEFIRLYKAEYNYDPTPKEVTL